MSVIFNTGRARKLLNVLKNDDCRFRLWASMLVEPFKKLRGGISRRPTVVADVLECREANLFAAGFLDCLDHFQGSLIGHGAVLGAVECPHGNTF